METPRVQSRLRRRIEVSVLLLLLIGVGIPVWNAKLAKTMSRNESAAIAHLKNLSSAQAQLQASMSVDRDYDGEGEYGDLRELKDVVAASFQQGSATRVALDGYVFEVHLPKTTDQRERAWSIYAWPQRYGWTGRRAFFVNEHGDVLASANLPRRYSGSDNSPDRLASYLAHTRELAVNEIGRDGMRWTVV